MKTGTAHFISRDAAIRYYREYGYDDTAAEVDRKLADGEIYIGPPELKPGQRLARIDAGTRYAIEDQGAP